MGPEMIILDEPTAGQDYRHYTEIMEFLKKLKDKILTNADIVREASLKETSLYGLSLKCGIEDGTSFVQRFIDYERNEVRSHDEFI